MLRTSNLYALAPGSIDGRAVNDGESKRHVSDISIPMRRSVKGCAIKEPPCIIKKHQKIGVEGNFLKHFLMVSNFSRCFFSPQCVLDCHPVRKKHLEKSTWIKRKKWALLILHSALAVYYLITFWSSLGASRAAHREVFSEYRNVHPPRKERASRSVFPHERAGAMLYLRRCPRSSVRVPTKIQLILGMCYIREFLLSSYVRPDGTTGVYQSKDNSY